ncbi:unnamed protein product [Cuscuta epithymum]|uniref:Uncharacterized protein n=1 Tax=Cuscuta epithymum TaxID=186058 RepID=A0AAV0CZW5_9ASTE|nr:unnamed protein product [Cuscuta epithymum]
MMALNSCLKHIIIFLASSLSMQSWTGRCGGEPTPTAAAVNVEELPISEHFEQWMILHERSYRDEVEKAERFEIFKKNKAYVDSFNLQAAEKNHTYTLGINQFSDMTDHEFSIKYLSRRPPSKRVRNRTAESPSPSFLNKNDYNVSLDELPGNVDWRDKGAVTGVKDQKRCGCCWAFSAVAALEGMNKIFLGTLFELSEQNVIDCTPDRGHDGCWSKHMIDAFNYAEDNDGVASEKDYPFVGVRQQCKDYYILPTGGSTSNYGEVPENNEMALLAAVARQPVSVGLTYSPDFIPNFKSYRSGIFNGGLNGDCGTGNNHAVAIVGYGTVVPYAPYWIVKNSWGARWGEYGYMRMARQNGKGGGTCGINNDPVYPIPYSTD